MHCTDNHCYIPKSLPNVFRDNLSEVHLPTDVNNKRMDCYIIPFEYEIRNSNF